MDILSDKQVKTRKPHVCFGCGRKIPAGLEMNRQSTADGGTVFTTYLCQTCQRVGQNIIHEYGYCEYCFGDLKDDAIALETEELKHEGLSERSR